MEGITEAELAQDTLQNAAPPPAIRSVLDGPDMTASDLVADIVRTTPKIALVLG